MTQANAILLLAVGGLAAYLYNKSKTPATPTYTAQQVYWPGTNVPIPTNVPAGTQGQATVQIDDAGNVMYYDVSGNYVGYADPAGVFHAV